MSGPSCSFPIDLMPTNTSTFAVIVTRCQKVPQSPVMEQVTTDWEYLLSTSRDRAINLFHIHPRTQCGMPAETTSITSTYSHFFFLYFCNFWCPEDKLDFPPLTFVSLHLFFFHIYLLFCSIESQIISSHVCSTNLNCFQSLKCLLYLNFFLGLFKNCPSYVSLYL